MKTGRHMHPTRACVGYTKNGPCIAVRCTVQGTRAFFESRCRRQRLHRSLREP